MKHVGRKHHAGKWLTHPQTLPARNYLMRLHLWLGVLAGIYITAMGVTGCVLVFYEQFYTMLTPRPKSESTAPVLSLPALRKSFERTHSRSTVNWIWIRANPRGLAEVWYIHDGHEQRRYLNAYSGADLGAIDTAGMGMLDRARKLHLGLLGGTTGRVINEAAAIVLTLLSLTGLAIWWPGITRWRRHLYIRPRTRLRRLMWEFHSAIGLWSALFLLMWGLTGALLVPGLLKSSPIENWAYRLHFGSFGGHFLRSLWGALGALVPAGLFGSGVLMWRNRVAAHRRFAEADFRSRKSYLEGPPSF